ncbi:MAG: cyclic pyranopterin monophosphate synthase MoaC [Thermodesulfovibrionales bacterium]
MKKLSHTDSRGKARMVDVSEKPVTQRIAVAQAAVIMKRTTLALIRKNEISKGDVLGVARTAGIMAAKKTAELIPLCHPLPITSASVELSLDAKKSAVLIEARVKVSGKTGVEMEALTAAAVAALTVYDMCKAVDREMTITDVMLLEKQGGRSGVYTRKR